MVNLYESYDSMEEKDSILSMEAAELDVDKAIFAYDCARKIEDIKLREAELSFVESGGG